MAKILTDKELAEIVTKAVEGDDIIGDAAPYEKFLCDLGELVALHMGAECTSVSSPLQDEGETDAETRWCIGFAPTESTPSDGGVFAEYDTDITVEDWFADFGIPRGG